MLRRIAAIVTGILLLSPVVGADDGAASIAAGGIVMKHEPRVTMAKEVLRISPGKVTVSYDFRNDTDVDISTLVAFPVPSYSLDWDEHHISDLGFDDFHLSVDGKPIHFNTEAKAFLKERDVSGQLRKLRVDIPTFGHFNEKSHIARDIRRLTPAQRASLVKAGLLDAEADQDEATWKVKKNYYWQQTFAAHGVVHIEHDYTPVVGNTNSISYGIHRNSVDPYAVRELDSFCLKPELRAKLAKISDGIVKKTGEINLTPWPYYVDFILTTANTWKTPIEDFTLVVDRPHAKKQLHTLASFCWDGPVSHPTEDEFVAHTTNFIPKRELRIGFIAIPTQP